MENSTRPGASAFLRIPVEIRNIIYRILLRDIRLKRRHVMLTINRQIHDEFLDVICRDNCFAFAMIFKEVRCWVSDQDKSFSQAFPIKSFEFSKHLRHAEVQISCNIPNAPHKSSIVLVNEQRDAGSQLQAMCKILATFPNLEDVEVVCYGKEWVDKYA